MMLFDAEKRNRLDFVASVYVPIGPENAMF